MDCLRSFQININQSRTFSTAGVDVEMWGPITNYNWTVDLPAVISSLDLTGFKNIDLYGIKMNAAVQSPLGIVNSGIVNDYGFAITFSGIAGQINSNFSTNGYAATTTNSSIRLTKYQNELTFASPTNGCRSVTIENFFAQGINAELLNSITLSLTATFVFYYKFEGE